MLIDIDYPLIYCSHLSLNTSVNVFRSRHLLEQLSPECFSIFAAVRDVAYVGEAQQHTTDFCETLCGREHKCVVSTFLAL